MGVGGPKKNSYFFPNIFSGAGGERSAGGLSCSCYFWDVLTLKQLLISLFEKSEKFEIVSGFDFSI